MDRSPIKKLYTTHEVARLLGVTPITVIRWIEGGKFKCFTTVGGHRRIEHDELVQFAQAYNLPWRGDEELARRKEYIVLTVDDDEGVLELFRDMLAGVDNLKLIEVNNAFSAGARLVEERPDFIFLDFLMPELDGFEFCRFVRQDPRFREVPIVAITGLKTKEDFDKIRAAGADDIISKPFSMDTILEKIEFFRAKQQGRHG